MGGFEDGAFRPADPVTREQLAVMLRAYAEHIGKDTSSSASLSRFHDNSTVSSWAEPSVKWCVQEGLLGGRDDGALDPSATATRAEMAQILKAFCENVK